MNKALSAGRSGFSLVETAIVLGLVGVVVGGIFVATTQIRQKTTANGILDGMVYTLEAIRSLFSGNVAGYCQSIGCTPNINVTAQLVSAGVIPDDYQLDTTTTLPSYLDGLISNKDILHSSSGVDMLYMSGDWSIYGNIYGLKFAPVVLNISQSFCVNILSSVSSRFQDSKDLEMVETSNGQSLNIPLSLDTITGFCAPFDSGDNFIIFYFNPY